MLLLLNYTETEWLSQQFATRTESVTPFLVSFWQSTIKVNTINRHMDRYCKT